MPKRSNKENRRSDILDAALAAFVERGFEGTSVADLAKATDLSKAAFVYHFDSKEQLLFELSAPLLDDLDRVANDHRGRDTEPRALIADYLDALCRHHVVAAWVDGDKSVLNHGDLGARLDANNRLIHRLLAGPRPSAVRRAQGSAVLGMLWRPIRNGYLADDQATKEAIIDLAATAAEPLTVAR